MTKHYIIERDVQFTETTLEYDESIENLKHGFTTTGDSLSSYDAEYRCTCGNEFSSFENAREHASTRCGNR